MSHGENDSFPTCLWVDQWFCHSSVNSDIRHSSWPPAVSSWVGHLRLAFELATCVWFLILFWLVLELAHVVRRWAGCLRLVSSWVGYLWLVLELATYGWILCLSSVVSPWIGFLRLVLELATAWFHFRTRPTSRTWWYISHLERLRHYN